MAKVRKIIATLIINGDEWDRTPLNLVREASLKWSKLSTTIVESTNVFISADISEISSVAKAGVIRRGLKIESIACYNENQAKWQDLALSIIEQLGEDFKAKISIQTSEVDFVYLD